MSNPMTTPTTDPADNPVAKSHAEGLALLREHQRQHRLILWKEIEDTVLSCLEDLEYGLTATASEVRRRHPQARTYRGKEISAETIRSFCKEYDLETHLKRKLRLQKERVQERLLPEELEEGGE